MMLESKLLNGIKSTNVDSSAYVRVKVGESEWFRVDSGVYHVPLAVKCIYGWREEGSKDGVEKEGSELFRGWERVEIPWPLVCR